LDGWVGGGGGGGGNPGLTCNHQTRLEKLARDKHSSLFSTFVKDVRKVL
jgi:hypothetical protein